MNRVRRMLALVVAASVLGAICLAFAGAVGAAASSTGLQLVGRIPFGQLPAPTLYTLTVDPVTNRGFVVVSDGGVPKKVRVIDLGSQRTIGETNAPTTGGLGQGYNGFPDAVVDPKGGRVAFLDLDPVSPPASTCGTVTGFALAWLDEKTLTWSETPVPCIPQTGNTLQVKGMTYDDATHSFYLVGMDGSDAALPAAPVRHFMMQIDHLTGAVISTVQLDCDGHDGYNWPHDFAMIGLRGGYAYSTCLKSNPTLTAMTSRQNSMMVVKAALSPTGQLGGPVTDELEIGDGFGSMFDPGAGISAIPSDDPGYDFGTYVMDVTSGLFRGFVPTSNDQSLTGSSRIRAVGLNPANGRLYMQTHDGMILSDIRDVPVPVGLSYPEQRDAATNEPQDAQLISVDPIHSRIFVPDFQDKVQGWDIYQDDTPPTAAATASNPDASTTDVAEATGVTGSTYSGAAEAFGARALSEGGVNRVIESHNAATGGCQPTPYDQYVPNQNPIPAAQITAIMDCPYSLADSPGDRDWYLGHAGQASLTNVGATAHASAVDVQDAATAKDFQNADVYGTTVNPPVATPAPSSSATPLPNSVPGLFGPYPSASPVPAPSSPPPAAHFPADRPQDRPTCTDFGGAPNNASESHSFGNANVSCNQNGGSVIATGTAQPGSPTASSVGSHMTYYGKTEISRTTADGVVTTATADVQHVSLPPIPDPTVYIREIKTTATTRAHGRPGTASASFTRKIYGFSSIGAPGSAMSYSCSDDTANKCDPQKVADALTAAFRAAGLTASAYVHQPDPTYLKGTPGGFQALVTKDALLRQSDATVNDDSSDTVTGLEIVVYNDGAAGRSRQILQFAGVHAESHYGIYLLGTDGSFAMPAPTPDNSTPQVVTQTIDNSVTKTIVKTKTVNGSKNHGFIGVLQHVADLIQQGWRLLVSDPGTAAALAGLWALLVSPVYLAMRRRALLGKVAVPRGV
jgi:hypothetical protein